MDATNLKVYLPFDTSATDDLTGGTWTAEGTPSIVSRTLQLDGSSCVQSDDTFTLGGQDFTISCKVSMDSAAASYSMLCEATTAKGDIPRIEISRYGTNNKLVFYANELWSLSPNFNVPVNQVFHLEFDYSHSAGKFYVFVDGSLVSTTNKSLAQKTFAALTVGANTRGSSKWLGSIDEFIIYDGVALHDANFTPPTADEYNELKLALGARAYLTTEFDIETRVHNGLKGWRYYNPGYGERLKTGGTTIQTDRSVTGVAFHGGQQSDMFWTPDGLKEIWMRFDMISPLGETINVSYSSRCYINAGHKSQTQNKIFGFTANTSEITYYLRVNKLVLPDDAVIWLTADATNQCLIHMVSGAIDGLFEITINGSTHRYTGNINGGDDFNNIFLYSFLSPIETDDKRVLFSNVVISQTPITIEDGWHVDSVDVESKIIAPVLNLRARGETHKFKYHTKKSKPANAISVAGRKFYGKYIATTDDNAGVIRVRYDDANYALSKL